MSQTFEFYSARAKAATEAAEAATLDNVRQRNLQAAASWTTLAEQAHRVREQRQKAEAEKADRDAIARATMHEDAQG